VEFDIIKIFLGWGFKLNIKNYKIRIIKKMYPVRIFRYIRYFFIYYIKQAIKWRYESCKMCGRGFRINWSVENYIWKQVMGVKDETGGSLCIDCFMLKAEKKGIILKKEDVELDLFYPNLRED